MAIAVEKLNEFKNPIQLPCQHLIQPLKHKTLAKRKQAIMTDADTDADNTDFSTSAKDGSDYASDAMEISNEEVQNILM